MASEGSYEEDFEDYEDEEFEVSFWMSVCLGKGSSSPSRAPRSDRVFDHPNHTTQGEGEVGEAPTKPPVPKQQHHGVQQQRQPYAATTVAAPVSCSVAAAMSAAKPPATRPATAGTSLFSFELPTAVKSDEQRLEAARQLARSRVLLQQVRRAAA